MSKVKIIVPKKKLEQDLFVIPVGSEQQKVKIAKHLKKVSASVIEWQNNIVKGSLAVGATEMEGSTDDNASYGSDTYIANDFIAYKDIVGQNDYIAYYDRTYEKRRMDLRAFALDATIESCLEKIADEVIIMDTSGYFAYPDINKLASKMKSSPENSVYLADVRRAFMEVYRAYNFEQSDDAWQLAKRFLIDGILAFEIIFNYDEKGQPTHIIAFKEIDPVTIKPTIRSNGKKSVKVWVQEVGDSSRDIPDSNIVYISWSNVQSVSRISYVDRLVRSFKVLKTLEDSRVIWNVWNAQKRVKITVPTGNKPQPMIRQELAIKEAEYKEEVFIDQHSGQVIYNGSPNFPFSKNYMIPSNVNGQGIDFSSMGFEGYNLNSTEVLEYFYDKFINETQIPRTRFTNSINKGAGNISLSVESNITREEYAFSRFTSRIRNVFKEILLKPLWIQLTLKHPELIDEHQFRSAISIVFNEENLFKMIKEREVLNEGVKTVIELSKVKDSFGKPYFDPNYLLEKYLGLKDSDRSLNDAYKKRNAMLAKKFGKNNIPDMDGENPDMMSGLGSTAFDMADAFSGNSFGGGMGAGDINIGGDSGMNQDMDMTSPSDMGGSPLDSTITS